MPKKLKKGFVERKSVVSKAEDYGKEDASKSPMEAPVAMETYSSELEVPSTSENTSENAISLLEPENLIKINNKVSALLNDRFQNKNEIVVNRRVLEEIVSKTLGHLYSQEDKLKDISEAKNLEEKCKTLEYQQIELNKKRYALEKLIKNAKCTIKGLIEEKCLFNQGTVRRILPGTKKRQVRSVGLQVCLVGPLLMSRPVTNYFTCVKEENDPSTSKVTDSNSGQYSHLLSEEPSTARKHNAHIEVDIKRQNEPSSSKVTDSNSALKTEAPIGRKSNITSRKMPKRKTKKIVKDLKKLSPVEEMSIEQIDQEFEKLVIKEEKVHEPPSMKIYNTRSRSKNCANCSKTPQEETPSMKRYNTRSRTMTKDCPNCRGTPQEETPSGSSLKEVKYFNPDPEIFQEPTISGAPINETPSGSSLNIVSRRMSKKKTQLKEVEYFKTEPEIFQEPTISGAPINETSSGSSLNIVSRRMSKKKTQLKEVEYFKPEPEIFQEPTISGAPINETSSGSSLNIVSRRMSKKKTQLKEVEYFKPEPEIFQEPTISGAPINETSSGSKSKIKTRRMPTRKMKVGNNKPLSAAKAKSIKELNESSKQIVNEQTCDNIIVISDDEAVEMLDDLIVISSDDDMVQNTKCKVKESQGQSTNENIEVMDYDKKDIAIQINMDIDDNSIPESNKSSSSQGPRKLIKVWTPEEINEQFLKSLCSSYTAAGENRQFNKLPQYPTSPHYPDSCKPPAPVLVVGKNSQKQGIVLKWSFACETPKNIMQYQLFCYQEKHDGQISNFAWEKVGDIKALPVPMVCYLSYDKMNTTYHFILRAIDNQKLVGDFSSPANFKL